MAWHYEIDPKRRLVTVVVKGEMTDADLLEWSAQLRDDPDFSPDYSELVDLRSAKDGGVTVGGVENLAADSPLFSPRTRRAIVLSTDLGYWMGRLFKVLRDEKAGEIRFLRHVDAARRWLELP